MTMKGTKQGGVFIKLPDLKSVGARLKFLRASVLGLSRSQLQELINIPVNTIKHYELGTRKVSSELLTAIAECVVTHSYFDWLFHGEVSRTVQVDPVSGTHSLSLLTKIADAIHPLSSGPAVLPAELAAEIRTAISRAGAQR
ncbi:helix-turn-helix transcriptional regulator [Aeromonas hydrophila]